MKNCAYRLRNYEEKDIHSLVHLLLTTWTYDFMATQDKREKATELFLLSYLSVSDHKSVLLDQDRVIGFISAHENAEDSVLCQEYKEKRERWSHDKEIESLIVYNDIIHSVNNAMTEEFHPIGTEITLFIIDPEFRGKGLGSFLLQEMMKRAKGPFYLYSDLDCSYRFYLNNGFRIAGEKERNYSFFGKSRTFHSFLFLPDDTNKAV